MHLNTEAWQVRVVRQRMALHGAEASQDLGSLECTMNACAAARMLMVASLLLMVASVVCFAVLCVPINQTAGAI